MRTITGKLRLAGLLCATLFLAACDPTQMNTPLRTESTPDPSAERTIAAKLARGYSLLADYDDYIANDAAAGIHFRNKHEQAAAGTVVEPDPADGPETEQARELLDRARGRMRGGDYATAYAEAQINYDCWLDRRVRQDASASFCKEKLYKAIARLDLAPASHGPSEQHYAVYFHKGSALPDSAAFTTIRQAAAAYVDSPDWHIHLTGHAYGEKNKKADVLLSMRRAIAVRNVLLQNGVDSTRIVLGAVGDTGGKKTEGGRVDIAIIEASRDQPDEGPDIQKIVPQYFGKDDPEL
jgi:outer membrane protein OmpA-like peptidoglycan-associated protein